MSLVDEVRSVFRSRAEEQPAPPVPQHLTISIPDTDDDQDEAVDLAPGQRLQTEGQSFIIEYSDANGEPSLRRITVWSVEANRQGIPLLISHCHERNAKRSFRVDSVQSIADLDGAIIDPLHQFYSEVLGIRWPSQLRVDTAELDRLEERWLDIRETVRDSGVVLLALLAMSDGRVGKKETAEITASQTDAAGSVESVSRMSRKQSLLPS